MLWLWPTHLIHRLGAALGGDPAVFILSPGPEKSIVYQECSGQGQSQRERAGPDFRGL